MRKVVTAFIVCLPLFLMAQENAVVQEAEVGIGVGAGHYFGDLNNRFHINRPKVAASLFFRKNFSNYVAMRVGASYARVGYSDRYNTHNEFMQRRNLSFNSNIWELSLQGDFNFYRFMPGDPQYRFTPYVTFGVGIFNYDPFAYLNDEKHLLRPLGTEGQGSSVYPDRQPYSSMAMSIPLGIGFKYSLNEQWNVGFEVVHRFTNTDYLDDVSKTYVNPAIFPPEPNGNPSPAFLLQDRSYETGTPIGKEGVQRGNSRQKDGFATALFFISYNIQSYKCPPSK